MPIPGSNVFILGNKSQNGTSNTIKGQLKRLIDAIDSPTKCYPSLAVGVNVATGSGTAWLQGSAVEIMPANTASGNFQIFSLIIEDKDSSGYEWAVTLYAGSTELGTVKGYFDSNDSQVWPVRVSSAIFAKTQAITAKAANSSTTLRTPVVSLMYREVT